MRNLLEWRKTVKHFIFLACVFLFSESKAIVLEGNNTMSIAQYELVKNIPNEIAQNHPNFGKWYKLTIEDKSTDNWVLEFVDFRIDDLEIYIPSNDFKSFKKYHTGDAFIFSTRPILHKNLVFSLPKNVRGSYTIYFCTIHSTNSEFVLKANLRTQSNFAEYGFAEYAFLAFFYGILVCMTLYNLFLFIFTRDYVHLFYVGYVVSLALFSLSRIDGLGFQYLWPSLPIVNSFLFSFALGLFVASSIGFATHFLQLKYFHPKFYSFLIFYAFFRIAESLISVMDFFEVPDLKLLDLAVLVFLLAIGLKKEFSLKSPVRFFLAGYLAMLLGFALYTLQDYDLIHHTFRIYYALNYGVMAETILLSIALSEKTKAIIVEKQNAQKEVIAQLRNNETLQEQLIKELQEKEALKDKVNRELTQKVKERTLELETKNQLLNEQNQKIEKLASQIDLQYFSLKKEAQKKELEHVWNKHLSYEEFLKLYPTEASCLAFLEKEKWPEGFTCVKCGYEQYTRNQTNLSRKCNRCSHIESVTANTMYHGIHIPIQKAMYIAHCVIHGMDKINVSNFAKTIDLRLNTCRAFIAKVESTKSKK